MTTHPRYSLLAGAAALTASLLGPGGLGLGVPDAHADRGVASTLATPENDKGAGILGLKVGAYLPQAFQNQLTASYFVELEAATCCPSSTGCSALRALSR